MKIQCPQCRQTVPADHVNMASDMAFCPTCKEDFTISESMAQDSEDFITVNEDLIYNPPKGAWFIDDGYQVSLGTSTRSSNAFLFLFVIFLFRISPMWKFFIPLFSKRIHVVPLLFSTPFILALICLCTLTFLSIFGKISIKIQGEDSNIFVGIGWLGWTRRFDWTSITEIGFVYNSFILVHFQGILLEGKRKIAIGKYLLNEKRGNFILNALLYLKKKGR